MKNERNSYFLCLDFSKMLRNVDLITFCKNVPSCAELCRTLGECAVKVKKSLRQAQKVCRTVQNSLKLCEESAVKI